MQKTIFSILVITSLLLVNAQEPPAQTVEPQTKTAVTPQKRLRELTLSELDKKNKRAREAGEIAAKFKNIKTLQNIDLRITEYLRLQKRIAKLQQDIQNANNRQADLAEEIRAAIIDPHLSLQESERMRECRQYIDDFARAQRTMALQLKKLSDTIQVNIFKLPPPPNFMSRSGLKMCLVGTMPNAFYVSEECIPAELFDAIRTAKALNYEPVIAGNYSGPNASASYHQATAFCKWLTLYESAPYQLPELKHLQMLPNFNILPKKAIWCASTWSPDDINYSRSAERFGIKLQNIWDPQHLLSEQEFAGELPEASYKNLGFIVITNVRSGIRQRLEALMKTVGNEAEDNQETQPNE